MVAEPDALLFGMPRGKSYLCVLHFCTYHDTQADAAAVRSALIEEARGAAWPNS